MNKILSSLLGGAIGDALGYGREFSHPAEHLARIDSGDWRDADYANVPVTYNMNKGRALISDDTQMTLATGRALQSMHPATDYATAAKTLAQEYAAWSISPDNNRAPGNACMRACGKLRLGYSWQDATDVVAMGSGANMRVAPIALYPHLSAHSRVGLAMLSAAITHAHPAAVAASCLTVEAIWAVHKGLNAAEILPYLFSVCDRCLYPSDALGALWAQSEYGSAEAYMRAGFARCAEDLEQVQAALTLGWDGSDDPCVATGEGWIASEALAGALLCVLGLWDDPVAALKRAAVSLGDSDSLAAIAGNIIGARGVDWPRELVNGLEVAPKKELRALASWLGSC